MKEHSYYKDTPIEEIEFPNADLRRVGHLVRNVRPIPGYRAVVDKNTDRTFAIVKDGYQLVRHEDAITQLDEIVREHPEWGEPVREIWMSNHGGRMKTRWTFPEVEFEIGKTSDGKPDTVNPTIETFCSLDTSLARALFLGGFRLICTNGMKVGKTLAEYKHKHTASLDLDYARSIISQGMADYSKATGMWLSFKQRNAFMKEVNAFEVIGFNKEERESVEVSIKRKAQKLIAWDNDPDERKVEINAWDLYNIFTDEASHRISDITRQQKVFVNIANAFVY
jgi:hypothetical protein